MVCSLESGRMATMARILVTGDESQTTADEVDHQKLAAQYIQRGFHEADEANLLDEEDMHVFGLKPMGDPLHLVCCNACKKPVKTSQYAAHAEICRLLDIREDTIVELGGVVGHKKPPRKKKQIAVQAKQAATVRKQAKAKTVNAAGSNASAGSHLDEQVGSGTLLFGKGPHISNGMGVNSENGDCLTGDMAPPMKRAKPIAAGCQLLSNNVVAARRVTEVTSIIRPEAATSVPAPLATKIYYSQRNNRLRAALGFFFEDMAKEN